MKRPILWFYGLLALTWSSCSTPAPGQASWFGAAETSPTGLPAFAKLGTRSVPPPTTVKGTIRYRVRVSQGGRQVRIMLTNAYSETPLAIQAVSVGLAGKGLAALPGSLRRSTFAGETAIAVPAGARVLTDPIDLPVKPLGDILVSVYVPAGVSVFAWTDEASRIDPGLVEGTDATMVEQPPEIKNLATRPMVSEVDVLADHPVKVVLALGDSITDSSVDPATGERGWPGALACRLSDTGLAVVNSGIVGNRLLQSVPFFGSSALARLDEDVFSVPGLSAIVVLEGINDIGMSGQGGLFGDTPLVKAEDMVAAYGQIIARAHERGIKVFGATILPFAGAFYYSEEKERIRGAVNAWIRTSRAFDGVIDFDAAMRDPANPDKLKAEFDSGDHLHPSFAGSRQMGETIDLRIFGS